MKAVKVALGVVLVVAAATGVDVVAQQPTAPPTTASAEVMQCAQAQMVVDQLLTLATARLESARQANTAAELRAAVDSMQSTVRDARAQLAPCATMQPAAGAAMDHSKMPMGTAPPTTPAPAATAPAATPMDHSKMPMAAAPAAKPAPGAKPPAAAPMDHSKMPMGTAPAAKPAPGAKPPAAAPMDHANMPMGGSATDKSQPTDPVCGLKVDPATAPKATHGGQTYHFCSEQHRELFQKNPAKYLPKAR